MTNKAFIYYQWNDYNLKEPPHKANTTKRNANEKYKKNRKKTILLIVYREYQLGYVCVCQTIFTELT